MPFAFLVVPTLVAVALAFGKDAILLFPPRWFTTTWFGAFFADAEWTGALVRSTSLAFGVAIAATVIGTAAGLALTKGRVPFRGAIEIVCLGPMIIPPIVLAVGGFGIYADLHLLNSLWGLGVVHAALAVPFVVLLTSAALARSDRYLEMASASLGGGPVITFWRVTLPTLMPAVLTGALFAFLTSFDEVVIARFLIGSLTPTLPLKIFGDISYGASPIIAAVSTLQIGFALCCVAFFGGLSVWQERERA